MQELLFDILRRLDSVSSCASLVQLTNYIPPFWFSEILSLAMLGSVIGVAVGLMVMLYPAFVWDMSRLFSRWGERMEGPLNQSIRIERWFYRHNKFTGGAICLLSAYLLSYYLLVYNRVFIYHYFSFFYNPLLVDWFLASIEFLFVAFFMIALVFGTVVFFRPSLIKRIETIGNTWIIPVEDLVKEIPAPQYPSRWLGLRVLVINLNLVVIYTMFLYSSC